MALPLKSATSASLPHYQHPFLLCLQVALGASLRIKILSEGRFSCAAWAVPGIVAKSPVQHTAFVLWSFASGFPTILIGCLLHHIQNIPLSDRPQVLPKICSYWQNAVKAFEVFCSTWTLSPQRWGSTISKLANQLKSFLDLEVMVKEEPSGIYICHLRSFLKHIPLSVTILKKNIRTGRDGFFIDSIQCNCLQVRMLRTIGFFTQKNLVFSNPL